MHVDDAVTNAALSTVDFEEMATNVRYLTLTWKKQHMYGAEHLGTYMVEATLWQGSTSTTATAQVFELETFKDLEKSPKV